MDKQQQQGINRAAQEFTDALVAAYEMTSDRTVAAQQLGAQQIEYFFDTVIKNLRAQAEGSLQATQQLDTQRRLAREATRQLTQDSTDTYMDLLDSVFSFYQGGTSRTRRLAEDAQRRVEQAEARAEEAQGRAGEAQSARSEAQSRTEEANRSAREAQRRAEEAENSAEEANRRAERAERRAEEAQSGGSEAESRGGDDEEGDTNADAAVRQPLSEWVRTSSSARSRVRGRNIGSRGGTFGQGGTFGRR
jgi:chromosome segregation ATPase